MSGKYINTAVDYLNKQYPVILIPDQLFKRAGCDGKLSSLERNLRRAQKRGRVKVEYRPNEAGTDMIAHYQGVPEWKKLAYGPTASKMAKKQAIETAAIKTAPAAVPPPALFFYAIVGTSGFSPYYTSKTALKKAFKEGVAYKCFTGTHESPMEITL